MSALSLYDIPHAVGDPNLSPADILQRDVLKSDTECTEFTKLCKVNMRSFMAACDSNNVYGYIVWGSLLGIGVSGSKFDLETKEKDYLNRLSSSHKTTTEIAVTDAVSVDMKEHTEAAAELGKLLGKFRAADSRPDTLVANPALDRLTIVASEISGLPDEKRFIGLATMRAALGIRGIRAITIFAIRSRPSQIHIEVSLTQTLTRLSKHTQVDFGNRRLQVRRFTPMTPVVSRHRQSVTRSSYSVSLAPSIPPSPSEDITAPSSGDGDGVAGIKGGISGEPGSSASPSLIAGTFRAFARIISVA